SEATYLIDDLCAKGYNIVNVDYVLVPEGHFPDPLIQANQAFAYRRGSKFIQIVKNLRKDAVS
ncbi:MAG: hypothetical protein II189_05465, partial [Lachnospiraceae bacterium]|nr:hypothetical protein [Lachnospiraceae bacterium]